MAARRSAAQPPPAPSPLAARLQWILDRHPEKFSSPRALSIAADLGHSYVGLVLAGKRGATGRIDAETVRKLALATGYDPVWIGTGQNAPPGAPGADVSPVQAALAAPPQKGYQRRDQVVAAVKRMTNMHQGVADVLSTDDPAGHDLELSEWFDRAHEIDRMLVAAEAKGAALREPAVPTAQDAPRHSKKQPGN